MEEKNKNIIICYGTLRLNQGNYRALLEGRSEYLGEFVTEPKFKMFSTGGFPIVEKDGNKSIVCDIFEVNDEVQRSVHSLEGFSGVIGHPSNWYDGVMLETPYGEGLMYVMEKGTCTSLTEIPSGDWVNRFQKGVTVGS